MNSKLMLIVAIFVIIATIATNICLESKTEFVSQVSPEIKVVVDPGHGGIDGGAQSSEGLSEKNVNLEIGHYLSKLLKKEGIDVIMTRISDDGLYDDECEGTIRTLKTQDMHQRRKIIDDSGAELAVSIHLNSFSQDESVRGAQVFYPETGDEAVVSLSKKAAEILQTDLNSDINSIKKRTALAKSDVFLLQNVKCPTVIVECGFLSNPEEAELLSDYAYQEKIAKSLKASICKFLEDSD